MASFKTKDRVLETSVTTGTGDYTVAGAATGFQTFLGGVVSANDLVPYYAEDGVNWEAGIGTVLSGPSRLQRTHVLKSSNSNNAVNWGAGTRNLRCGWPAELNTPRYKSVSIAGAAGTQVLTQDEQRCDVLVLTGALTGNRTIEVDATPWRWIVFNNTSGAYTVTFKVTGQTGLAITQGKSKVVYCNGTDTADGYSDLAAVPSAATQSDQETATSTATFVSPGRQQFHPSAVKGWCKADFAGNAAGAYNVSSVSDLGVGVIGVNWNTDFSSTAYAAVANGILDPGATAATTPLAVLGNTNYAAGSSYIVTVVLSTYGAVDLNYATVIACGDQ